MANRATAIGQMCRWDPPAARAEVKRVLVRCRGHVVESARDLGIRRRQMLRLIHRFALWHLVWSLRRVARRPPSDELLKRWPG